MEPVSDLTVLSAMITPTVLILATGSLLLTTSQRLSRSIDRARKLFAAIEQLPRESSSSERHGLFRNQLALAAYRSRLLQRAMVCLYVALGLFVATSLAIGLIELTHLGVAWVPVTLGLTGALLLLCASALLITESRVALRAVVAEMAALTRLSDEHGV